MPKERRKTKQRAGARARSKRTGASERLDSEVKQLRLSRGDFTKSQIIAVAVRLFNGRGAGDVPVQAIADGLGMSLGNLQYHFRTKKDIIRSILPMMEVDVFAALAPPPSGFPSRAAADYHVSVLKTLWRYRFFFNALPELLAADRTLRTEYERFNNKVLEHLTRTFDGLIREGVMSKLEKPNSTSLIAWNLWICLIGWLNFEQVKNPGHEVPESEALLDAALQNLSLLQLYFPPGFAAQTMSSVRRRLKDADSKSVGTLV